MGVKDLAQGDLSGGDEGRASVALPLSPPRFIPPVRGLNRGPLTRKLASENFRPPLPQIRQHCYVKLTVWILNILN